MKEIGLLRSFVGRIVNYTNNINVQSGRFLSQGTSFVVLSNKISSPIVLGLAFNFLSFARPPHFVEMREEFIVSHYFKKPQPLLKLLVLVDVLCAYQNPLHFASRFGCPLCLNERALAWKHVQQTQPSFYVTFAKYYTVETQIQNCIVCFCCSICNLGLVS